MSSALLNSSLLQTLLCLVLCFALLSLLVSTLAEIVNSYYNERGAQLYKIISRLFDDNININFGQLLYNHPMITSLRKNINSLPQYISDTMFSQVIIEIIGNYSRNYSFDETAGAIKLASSNADIFERFKEGVSKMHYTPLKLMLMNMADRTESLSKDEHDRLAILESQIQHWYNDQMDRTSGWFKDLMRKRLRWIAFVVAITLNVDAIHLFSTLYTNPALRSDITAIAEQVADNYEKQKADTTITALQRAYNAAAAAETGKPTPDTNVLNRLIQKATQVEQMKTQQDSARLALLKSADTTLNLIGEINFPIGWTKRTPPILFFTHTSHYSAWACIWQVLLYIIGLLITAFSISVGAPFWFDVLLKLVNVRRAGKKPTTNTSN
ncbi:MAG: hypothetical protein J0I41_17670 [Filimonas sp.]|nr:hypothetical protein [Filimonas sp.]